MKCYLCPNDCGIDRSERAGLCKVGEEMRICRIAPHFYEEPVISGEKGSGTVFFSGCGLDCSFCQNYEISKTATGKIFTPENLADELKKLVDTGVHNINPLLRLLSFRHGRNGKIETARLRRRRYA